VQRRLRKRGEAPTPSRRLFINPAVCEGCGDCSAQSNCVAIVPQPTAMGMKRAIDQSACNQDLSCRKGFCPSFVELDGATLAGRSGLPDTSGNSDLPDPSIAPDANILIAGIGGTGVVTVGALIGMAAHLEGARFTAYDMTGLAQKGGAVFSHVRVIRSHGRPTGPRVPPGEADLLLGCDPQVAAAAEALQALSPARSLALLDSAVTAPGEYQLGEAAPVGIDPFLERIASLTGPQRVRAFAASETARRLLGDSVHANIVLLGAAAQVGRLPVSPASIEQAIGLNGAAVERNLAAFRLGRLLAAGRLEGVAKPPVTPETLPLEGLIDQRAAHLEAYQDRSYADRYRAFMGQVRDAAANLEGGDAFVRAVAIGLSRLMTYKDEYEVARLYSDPSFRSELKEAFADSGRLSVWLSPPLLARRDPLTGRPRKMRFGPWILTVFGLLARLKGVRGRWYDPFGWTRERQAERAQIARYQARILALCRELTPVTLPVATEIAALADTIRGYGPVKAESMARAARREAELLVQLEAARATATASSRRSSDPIERVAG
jgi:indolepyruvate ferredoxin oxidoreductase